MSPISASSKRSKDFDRFDLHKNLILILYVPINTMCKLGIGTAYRDGLYMGEWGRIGTDISKIKTYLGENRYEPKRRNIHV